MFNMQLCLEFIRISHKKLEFWAIYCTADYLMGYSTEIALFQWCQQSYHHLSI